ncbi:MAG: SMC-Scp complex subunit ScpB [Acidobacteriaceae bacterium]
MSLKAKIEAVIYAAEEPIALAQLAAIFTNEVFAEAAAASLPFENIENAASEREAESLVPPASTSNPGMLPPDSEEADPALLQEDVEAKKMARTREREARLAVQKIVDDLIADYANGDRGMEIREIAGGYRMATKPEYHDAVRSFVRNLKPQMKLSLQALETLAVVAYKQPVTAPEISEIRGVDTSGVLGGLMSRKLITTAGRKQVIGRPILYKTTKEFLLRFGLKDISELPSMEEFEKMAADMAESEASDMDALPSSDDSEIGIIAEAAPVVENGEGPSGSEP